MAARDQVILWCRRGVRLAVLVVFVWAGSVKARDPEAFRVDVERYQLVRDVWAWVLAVYVPWLEIVAALALLRPSLRRGAEIMLLLLTTAFIAALGSAWVRGLDVNCGCFGSAASEKANYPWWVGRDLLLLAAIGWLYHADRPRSPDTVR